MVARQVCTKVTCGQASREVLYAYMMIERWRFHCHHHQILASLAKDR